MKDLPGGGNLVGFFLSFFLSLLQKETKKSRQNKASHALCQIFELVTKLDKSLLYNFKKFGIHSWARSLFCHCQPCKAMRL